MSDEHKLPTAKPFTVRIYQEDMERFNRLAAEMDVNTAGGAFRNLMDFYENPPKNIVQYKDSQATIDRLHELEANAQTQTDTIADLQRQLEEAEAAKNTNAEAGTQLQLEIDRLKAENEALKAGEKHSPYYIGGELPPVPYFYASKMARLQSQKDKQERTPFYILANNFIQDLQNPLSNHLPITVSSDELRAAQADYEKSLKKTEQKEEE